MSSAEDEVGGSAACAIGIGFPSVEREPDPPDSGNANGKEQVGEAEGASASQSHSRVQVHEVQGLLSAAGASGWNGVAGASAVKQQHGQSQEQEEADAGVDGSIAGSMIMDVADMQLSGMQEGEGGDATFRLMQAIFQNSVAMSEKIQCLSAELVHVRLASEQARLASEQVNANVVASANQTVLLTEQVRTLSVELQDLRGRILGVGNEPAAFGCGIWQAQDASSSAMVVDAQSPPLKRQLTDDNRAEQVVRGCDPETLIELPIMQRAGVAGCGG
jgi:hypothetical protein